MRILFSLLIVIVCNCAFAQSPVIKISQEKIKENGVVKYVHTVKGGETLYSLAKAYNVTQDQIIANNPSVKNGLKEGSKIFIPSVETNNEKSAPAAAPAAVATKTAKESNKKDEWKTPKKKVYKKHTVRKYEVIDDIAAKYNVSVDALVAFNKLSSTKVTKKQVLYIPDEEFLNEFKKATAPVGPFADTVQTPKTDAPLTEVKESNSFKEVGVVTEKGGKANVAIVLPLNMYNPNNNTSNYLDFYTGALLAAESMKKDGYNIAINLVDQSTQSNINEIINSTNIKNASFVIGPVMSSSIKSALANKEIPFVSPLDQRADAYINGHSNFIQAPANNNTQIENITALMLSEYNNQTDKVILIYEDNGANAQDIAIAKKILDSAFVSYDIIQYNILDGREILPKFRNIIKEGKTYKTFVIASAEAFVNDVARNLNLCAKNNLAESASYSEITLSEDTNIKPIDIILYGLPKWRNFETIEPYNFHNLELRLSLPYYVDYSLEETKEFLFKYRALSNTEPSPFAYQGYDITKYFILMYCRYGADFVKKEKLDRMQMIQSNFNFVKDAPINGFRNKATTNIRYNKDFSISVIQ